MGFYRVVYKTLFFSMSAKDFERLERRHLWAGLFIVWLAGMGRYWDHPNPHFLQRLGLGSVIYVFVLAGMLSIYYWPLKVSALQYEKLLTFICLTSPPALLYAIPVEKFLDLEMAQTVNFWFLAIVAAWRLSLLIYYLMKAAGQSGYMATILALGPMAIIVTTLTVLNLEKAVFEIMGTGTATHTANDGAYAFLMLLSFLSVFVGPILLLLYWASFWGKPKS